MNTYPTHTQNSELDSHISRLGDEKVKRLLGITGSYSDMVARFDSFTQEQAAQVLQSLRERR